MLEDERAVIFNDFYRDKSVLVTGHTGFKGSWLSRWLIELGAHVTGLSIDIPTEPSHYSVTGLDQKLQSVFGDVNKLSDITSVFEAAKPEVVIHLAAQSLVRMSYDEPINTFATNILGTANILEAARLSDTVNTVLIVTTDKCYENLGTPRDFKEDDRLGGSDPYSCSKACAELVTASYFRSFFSLSDRVRVASARAGNVIGGGDWSKDRLIVDCVKAASQNEAVVIRNPDHIRPWQHVLEPVSAYLGLVEQLSRRPELNGEAFNFGPDADACVPVREVVNEFSNHWPQFRWNDQAGKQTASSTSPSCEKKEAATLKLNCEKAKNVLGWQPRLSLPESVELTARWYRQFYEDSQANMADETVNEIIKYSAFLE